MALVETKTVETSWPGLGLELKAKVAIVNYAGKILTLRRSDREDSRQGEWDWPGGKFDEGELNISEVIAREVQDEELPFSRLLVVRPLCDPIPKIVKGGYKVTFLQAGIAEFPPAGVVLGGIEHDDYDWFSPDQYPNLNIPNKYKNAVLVGAPVLSELVELINSSDQIRSLAA